jgi:predicted Zn finger-like uncharacterized protein
MPVIITCPSCEGKLRVSDELRGRMVRCPACNHTFDTAPPAARPRHDPQDLPLQLSIDEPSSEPRPTPDDGAPGLVGAVELNAPEDEQPAPAPPRPEPPRRKLPRLSEDWDLEDLRRRGPRRDAEPDRGAAVLSLGIISLACLTISCWPVGLILGLIAWIMGQTDLRKMKRGDMDSNGEGMTRAGWICGIIGVILNGLITLGCLGFIGVIWYQENNRPLPTRTFTTGRAAPIRPGQPPPPNKPPDDKKRADPP